MVLHQKVVWLGFSAQKVGAGREDMRSKVIARQLSCRELDGFPDSGKRLLP
jgi:hypothetical protein